MTVCALAAAVWLVAVPRFPSTNAVVYSETIAIAALRCIASAQQRVHERGQIDRDGDGVGEFGYLAELSGRVVIRGRGERLRRPALSPSFGNVQGCCVARSGYRFAMFLPGRRGQWLPEAAGGGAPDGLDPDRAAQSWLLYAWPVHDHPGSRRCFLVGADGVVLARAVVDPSRSCLAPTPGVTGFCEREGGRQPALHADDVLGDRWTAVP